MSFQKEIDQAIKEKRIYFIGDSLPSDWYAAFRIWLPLAEAGDPKAQYNVGRCYAKGDGIEKDQEAAMEWFMKAAMQNEPRAHFNLYFEYNENKDTVKAQEWLTKAAELNEPRALNAIRQSSIDEDRAIAYKALEAGDKDKARSLYKALVEKGDVWSELGLIAGDVQISIEHTNTAQYYTYNAPIITTSPGYVSGGGSRTGTYFNPTILFKLKNNSSKTAIVAIWIETYDYLNPEKKIGDTRSLRFTPVGPGEVAEVKEELHQTDKTPIRVYFTGVTSLRRPLDSDLKPDEYLTYYFENKVLAWESKPKLSLFSGGIPKWLKAVVKGLVAWKILAILAIFILWLFH